MGCLTLPLPLNLTRPPPTLGIVPKSILRDRRYANVRSTLTMLPGGKAMNWRLALVSRLLLLWRQFTNGRACIRPLRLGSHGSLLISLFIWVHVSYHR